MSFYVVSNFLISQLQATVTCDAVIQKANERCQGICTEGLCRLQVTSIAAFILRWLNPCTLWMCSVLIMGKMLIYNLLSKQKPSQVDLNTH